MKMTEKNNLEVCSHPSFKENTEVENKIETSWYLNVICVLN